MDGFRRFTFAVAVALLLAADAALGQPLPETVPLETWGPAGSVSAVARQGDTLYVGGAFDYVGPATGPFAGFAIDGTQPVMAATGFEGQVRGILPLDGGWIVAGNIQLPGGDVRRVARLDAAGNLDPFWYVDVAGEVSSLATDGSRVFIGGSFSSVNGTPRNALAALDAATGAVLPWSPALTHEAGWVWVSGMLAREGAVYVAGWFTAANGEPRTAFAALDHESGATLPLVLPELAQVSAMDVSGDTLYAAGDRADFTRASVAVSISTGAQLPWSVPPLYQWVSMLVALPQRVYVASSDTVLALDAVTGATIGPPLVSGAYPSAMATGNGLLAVALRDYDAEPRNRVVTFDAATGQPRGWSVTVSDAADALALTADRLVLGGNFASAGGVSRHNVFALDLRTGRPTGFAPRIEGPVETLAVAGSVIVAGGSFHYVNGQEQGPLAALTPDSATVLPWSPLGRSYGQVQALAVAGGRLFVGGWFQVFGGFSRPHLAAVDLSTGSVTSWLPVPDERVRSLATTGDTLVAAGSFAALADGPRGSAAAFSIETGRITAWNPRANGGISDVAVGITAVALAGDFSMLGSSPRQGFGFVDANGAALPLALPFAASTARAVAFMGDQAIVGGRFIEGSDTRCLFAATPQSGRLPWSPSFDSGGNCDVGVLARYPDLLVAGGNFRTVGGRRVLNLAVFPVPGAGPPTSLRARVIGSQASVTWSAPAGTAPSSYIVEAGTAPGASDVGRFPVATPAIAGALPAGTFHVRVRAVVNGVAGQPSSEMIFTMPAVSLPPSAPAALSAAVAGSRVSLSWTAAAGNAESYVIEAGTSSGQSNLASFDSSVLDTTYSAVVAPGTYYVRVRARNGFGDSPPSNEVIVSVP